MLRVTLQGYLFDESLALCPASSRSAWGPPSSILASPSRRVVASPHTIHPRSYWAYATIDDVAPVYSSIPPLPNMFLTNILQEYHPSHRHNFVPTKRSYDVS
jgi:hypothetical protein